MLDEIVIPQAIPAKKVPGYQMPQDTTNLLSWEFVWHTWPQLAITGSPQFRLRDARIPFPCGDFGTRTVFTLKGVCKPRGRAI